jgi:hypothetical protein
VTATGPLPPGKFYVFALLDVGNAATEYNESNNMAVVSDRSTGKGK